MLAVNCPSAGLSVSHGVSSYSTLGTIEKRRISPVLMDRL